MIKKTILFFIILFTCSVTYAQTDSSHLRVSLLTCGTGNEVWATFGHTAIRVTDSANGTDLAFNYGTFSFGEGFELKFMRGKLLYYLSYYPYDAFLEEYVHDHRSVSEQVLLLDGDKKQQIYDFLQDNAREDKKYYKYDFFFDNCATRIRDVFPRSLGESFQFGKTVADTERITFRNIMNQYYYHKHWERFGVNLLLGSRIDKPMTTKDIMFLPDFLSDAVGGATVNGRKIAGEPALIIPGPEAPPAGVNGPLVLTIVAALLTILGLTVKKLKPLGAVMSGLVLLLTGLLGIIMLVMWLGTDHQGCQNNFNILWALPTNIVLAFSKKANKGRYAFVAILLIILSLLLHVLRIQEMPLVELWPLLLALLFIYGTIYKRNRLQA